MELVSGWDWGVVHPSLGALGAVPDRVPAPNKEQVLALVVELRKMRNDRKVGNLEPLAVATFDLFEHLNLGETLRFPDLDKKSRSLKPDNIRQRIRHLFTGV